MKKKLTKGFLSRKTFKVLLIMKLFAIFTFCFTMGVSASIYSQTTRLTINLENTTVGKAFEHVEEISEFIFLYEDKDIDLEKTVDIKFENAAIDEILQKVLEGQNVNCYFIGRQLVLTKPDIEFNNVLQKQDEIKINGVVFDTNGESLPGVSIVVKGTAIGTISDSNGEFNLTIPDDAVIIQFSFVGMKTQDVEIGGKKTFSIVMENDALDIDDVVIIGYGSMKKSDLTGSIVSVKGSDLESTSTKRVDQALQGRVTGITIQNTDGAPGGNTIIRIRGSNSVLGGNSALIVIDGLQGGDIDKLNPSDIESVEVLKDASATAIYGSRGANGVILITTKQGKIGKPTITYSLNVGAQQLSNKLDLLNAGDYARNINAVRALDNKNGTPLPIFTDEEIAGYDENGGTDWQDAIYRIAPLQNHQLTCSGGTKDVKYFLSGGYLNQEGILLNSGYKRYSFRSNVSATFNKWLSGGLNLSAVKDDGKSPAFGGESGENLTLTGAVLIAPRWGAVNPVYNEDGTYYRHPANFGPSDTWNPVASSLEVDPSVKSLNSSVNAFLNVKIIDGLELNFAGYANVVNSTTSKFYNEETKQGLPVNGKAGYGYLMNGTWEYYQGSAKIKYDKTIGIHHINVIAVAEQSSSQWNGSDLRASQFTVTETGLNALASASQVINYSVAYKRALKSYLGRVNYSLMDKYLLTASYRADGSSVFGVNNKWGYFPSASVAWKLSEEGFIKDLDLFKLFKFRFSWGVTGNQAISPYQTQASIGSGQNYPWNGRDNTDVGFGLTRPSNEDLKWESTEQLNLGLDLAMFDGRLTATFDIYKKSTTNLLLYRQLPTSTGFDAIIDNIGETENKGLEIQIGGDPVVGVFHWNTNFNISFNKNMVISLGDNDKISYTSTYGGYGITDDLMYLRPGEPFGIMEGYGYEGTWNTDEKEAAAVYGQLPGDSHYTDVNEDDIVDVNDIMQIGSALPKFVYGWNNTFSYKNFDLDFLFNGVYGNDIFNQTRIRLENAYEATSSNILNRWTPDNQNTDVPAYIDEATRSEASLVRKIYDVDKRTGRWVEDGSYIRLKNLVFGYNVPKQYISRVGISSLRVYVSGTNLLTFTKYSGYDPEVSSFHSNDAQLGIDLGNYPTAKVYSFGLNITF